MIAVIGLVLLLVVVLVLWGSLMRFFDVVDRKDDER